MTMRGRRSPMMVGVGWGRWTYAWIRGRFRRAPRAIGVGGPYLRSVSRVSDALDAHRARLGACRACRLGESIVPIQSLALSPRVMIVGQAPGKVEAIGGKPFA